MLDEKMSCQQAYAKNKCSPNTRLPAIINLCVNWEKCIHEPITVSKSKVLAETIGEMIDGFYHTLSLKTVVKKKKKKKESNEKKNVFLYMKFYYYSFIVLYLQLDLFGL